MKLNFARSYFAVVGEFNSQHKLLPARTRGVFFDTDRVRRRDGGLVIMSYNKVVKELASRPQGLTYSSDSVITEKINDITLIAINRPENRNAVNRDTARQLKHAFQSFDKDKYANVAVLYGKGDTFCAGYDLKELSSKSDNIDLLAEPPEIPFGPMGPSPLQITKPVIAAINGHAVAGGLELSLICDMRVAEESAVFGVFCRRFGVPLIDGGTVRLPKLIGLSRAMDMILTGRPVKADEALSFGLVNRVVPDGQALQQSIELAKQIAAFPQRCLRADRMSTYYSTYQAESLQDAMDFEYKTGRSYAYTLVKPDYLYGAGPWYL